MKFTDIFVRRPVLATVVSLVILLLGLRSINELQLRQYPQIETSQITIITAYPGASADLVQGFIKPLIFGMIISTVACHQGLRVRGGTQGVGRATTSAVVISSVTVLVVDFFLAKALLYIFRS